MSGTDNRQSVREMRAQIRWSAWRERAGLSTTLRYIQPAWVPEDTEEVEGWSLVCRFDASPADQGNPSLAIVQFLVANAPAERLVPGAELRLFEGYHVERAVVSISD